MLSIYNNHRTLHIAKSFQPVTTINIDYEIDSNCSEEVYSTQEGLVTSSMIDHRLNFEEMSTEEAMDLMEYIADGDFQESLDEEMEDMEFENLIEESYNVIEFYNHNEEFINMNFQPVNSHVSAWSYCTVCQSYGHAEDDH